MKDENAIMSEEMLEFIKKKKQEKFLDSTTKIANQIEKFMELEGVNSNYFIKKGCDAAKVFSVLRRGKKIARPNYSISSFIDVLNILDLEIKIVRKKK